VRFSAEIEQLHPTILWMRRELVFWDIPPAVLKKLELVVEEAFLNIIQHAYKGQKGVIDISLTANASQVIVSIQDHGPPFDPLSVQAKIDPDMPIELRELGGLGIAMIRNFMDEVRYERKGEDNVLTLIKNYKNPS
jgi:anti-sigma regulatory factor (Ser/Thr protein kinase)